jgi:hypothetical protein
MIAIWVFIQFPSKRFEEISSSLRVHLICVPKCNNAYLFMEIAKSRALWHLSNPLKFILFLGIVFRRRFTHLMSDVLSLRLWDCLLEIACIVLDFRHGDYLV